MITDNITANMKNKIYLVHYKHFLVVSYVMKY